MVKIAMLVSILLAPCDLKQNYTTWDEKESLLLHR